MTLKVGFNFDKVIEIFGDKIYNSDGSAFREQIVNALSHGCWQYHKLYGYTDDVFVRVVFDHILRKVIIIDNGMGMPEDRFVNIFASFGNSVNSDGGRSGQHGLGAMSFLRFSSSTLVESKSRESEEHYCYAIEDGKDIQPASNRTMQDYGTRIEITLKPSVRISELRNVVKSIAEHYPVKVVITDLNTEGSRPTANALESYGRVTEQIDDASIVYPAVKSLEAYVKTHALDPFRIESVDNHVEIWLSKNTNYDNLSLTLCNVPIVPRRNMRELNDTEFAVFSTLKAIFDIHVNIDDERGDYVPEHHRDELDLSGADKLIRVINESIIKFIGSISISTPEEFLAHKYRWVLDAHGVDEYMRPETHQIANYLQMGVYYRTSTGKAKSSTTLRSIIRDYRYVFISETMVKSVYDSFVASGHFTDGEIVFIFPTRKYDNDAISANFERITSEYESVESAKARLQIKPIKRNKKDIKITVHRFRGTTSEYLDDIEEDESVYSAIDEGLRYSDIDRRRSSISDYKYYCDLDNSGVGIIIAKAHMKKLERPIVTLSQAIQNIVNTERDMIINGVSQKLAIRDNDSITEIMIFPDNAKKLVTTITKLLPTRTASIAFVTPEEYQIIVLNGPVIQMHGRSEISIRHKDINDVIQSYMKYYETDSRPFDYWNTIAKAVNYNPEKLKLATIMIDSIIELFDDSEHKYKQNIIELSTKLVNTLFKMAPTKRAEWTKASTVIDHFAKELKLDIDTERYHYDDARNDIQAELNSLKSVKQILAEDTAKLGFDGYVIVGNDVMYFTHEKHNLKRVTNTVTSLLGDYSEVFADVIDGKTAIIATTQIKSRCPSYKSK